MDVGQGLGGSCKPPPWYEVRMSQCSQCYVQVMDTCTLDCDPTCPIDGVERVLLVTTGGRKTASASAQDGSPQQPTGQRFKKQRRTTAQLVRQLSEDSIKSPMAPEHVVVEVKSEETGEIVRKIVYVTDVNGTKTLDLYSGWNPDSQQHKLPIKELPPKVCQLVTLERLWVSHNKLSTLPVQVEQMFRLREVYLHKNNFEEIPTSLCRLPSLEILWLN